MSEQDRTRREKCTYERGGGIMALEMSGATFFENPEDCEYVKLL
jgi:hypothetical protein